ncbi:uncharacterized protein LOC126766532 [Bactrocera neohumeralis]|uniref:uncharacterized protein LOC126766532 n=1 Tax=Bactrocera neohumeralis TaxID=98809 RepID=UPI002166BCC6|nr:uncharacterized protein LOC126766532 [Bactrocera neohumeralis]
MLSALLQFLMLVALPVTLFFLYEQNTRKPRKAAGVALSSSQANKSKATEEGEEEVNKNKKNKQDAAAAPAVAAEEVDKKQKVDDSQTPNGAKNGHAASNERKNKTEEKEKKKGTAPHRSEPRILIAYASNSQNALTLSHKLFNAINGQLLELQQKRDAKALQNRKGEVVEAAAVQDAHAVTPSVKILELREEDSHACSVDTLLEADRKSPNYYGLIIFIVSTFTDGTAPPRSANFEKVLKDCYEDHRVPRDALSSKRFALFGLGDVAYGPTHFNAFGKHVVAYCRGMGAPHFVVPPVYATDAKVPNLFQVFSQTLFKWLNRVEFFADGSMHVQKKKLPLTSLSTLKPGAERQKQLCCSSGNGGKDGQDVDSQHRCGCQSSTDNNGEAETCGAAAESSSDGSDGENESGLDEIEDLIDDIETNEDDHARAGGVAGSRKELLNPRLRKNLEKQGYNLIGSHSGVKLCRWTKAMLRGRGGCYKHTFYNINSSQCMELTPSLACANKCIFCWRHHTNPVSTTFRWKVDEPQVIVDGGIERHVRMINTMRGVPGVSEENLQKAFTVRHCALSLVGEPIMYPRINEFLHLLHNKKSPISSFMVTNAQFPEQLRMLRPVTQLYLSIDAPTSDELKQIDRPLFEDYWERCLSCVDVLRKKKNTRTVFRLTLVNDMNSVHIANYADLVEKGWPDFIEVKGVTFCGTSHTNTINMKTHVPRHDEVIQFCAQLCDEIAKRKPNYITKTMNEAAAADANAEDDAAFFVVPAEQRNRPYHIACEHEHSCCVLIALDKFYFNNRWNTWIDYARFFELAAQYEEVHGLPPVLDHLNENENSTDNHNGSGDGNVDAEEDARHQVQVRRSKKRSPHGSGEEGEEKKKEKEKKKEEAVVMEMESDPSRREKVDPDGDFVFTAWTTARRPRRGRFIARRSAALTRSRRAFFAGMRVQWVLPPEK